MKFLRNCSVLAVVLAALCLLFVPDQVLAASEADLTFTLNSDGESYTVSDCDTSATGTLVVPATYNGKPVTAIGEGTFNSCCSLVSISLPEGITEIRKQTFYLCSGLTSVTIPDSVTIIDENAFYKCSSLASISIPNGVTRIRASAFSYCTSLVSVTLPDTVTYIGSSAFWYCTSLVSSIFLKVSPALELPSSVTARCWKAISMTTENTLETPKIPIECC